MGNCFIPPQDVLSQIVTRDGVDTNKVLGIKYIGSAASGLVLIAATTNDFTLTHGVLASEAVDNTIGASGVMDLTVYTTIQSMIDEINSSPNWEAWGVDLPGDYLTNISAGNGIFIVASPWDAAVQAKVAAGIFPLRDTSLGTIEDFGVGLTFNGPSSEPHGFDANVKHDIMKIVANVTFGGATDGLYIYECNDVAGTKTEVAHLALVTATITTFGSDNEPPLISTKGRRFVVIAKDASGAITSPKIEVFSRSYAFGPGVRKRKLYSQY
jgi:hypothetical protein